MSAGPMSIREAGWVERSIADPARAGQLAAFGVKFQRYG